VAPPVCLGKEKGNMALEGREEKPLLTMTRINKSFSRILGFFWTVV